MKDSAARPYQQLLDRLGNGEQFPVLKWLVDQGCEAEVDVGEGGGSRASLSGFGGPGRDARDLDAPPS